jgi:cytosine/adenosine deaminase-related metal-dependent hydrolase
LRFGITSVGDISQQMHLTRPLIKDLPIRCVSFGEVLGLAGRRSRFDELLPMALDRSCQTDRLRIGLQPHAPFTVDLDGYEQGLQLAKEQQMPLATHLAETADERAFLESHSGPFRRLWERLGAWSDEVKTFTGSPIEMANEIGMLEYPTLLAHVNYCDDRELVMLARGRASVVYCPRTHRYFRHPPHRWREMLAAGINVAVGTDSCASSPDLNLVDDLRLLRKIAPEVPAQTLWEMATLRAAMALRLQTEVGSLTPGKRADFVVFEVEPTDDPLEQILQSAREPKSVWLDAEPARSH